MIGVMATKLLLISIRVGTLSRPGETLLASLADVQVHLKGTPSSGYCQMWPGFRLPTGRRQLTLAGVFCHGNTNAKMFAMFVRKCYTLPDK